MSDSAIPGRQKGPPPESDLSQVIAHGPALSTAYGRYLGALLMLFAIAKARRGPPPRICPQPGNSAWPRAVDGLWALPRRLAHAVRDRQGAPRPPRLRHDD